MQGSVWYTSTFKLDGDEAYAVAGKSASPTSSINGRARRLVSLHGAMLDMSYLLRNILLPPLAGGN